MKEFKRNRKERLEGFRSGSASFSMVIFFSTLVGVLSMGFVSVMLNNMMQSTNYDLSQAALDSTMAGVEDAKIMLLKYNRCMAEGGAASPDASCARLVNAIQAPNSEQNCNLVGTALGRSEPDAKETPIQLSYSSTGDDKKRKNAISNNLEQAYTCVKVKSDVADYLGKLTPDTDFKVIPLRTKFNTTQGTVSPIAYIRIDWFNLEDHKQAVKEGYNIDGRGKIKINGSEESNGRYFGSAENNTFTNYPTFAPTIQLGLVQTPAGQFNLTSFDKSIGEATNRGLIYLRPYEVNNAIVNVPKYSNDTPIKGAQNTGLELMTALEEGKAAGFAASARTDVGRGGINQDAADVVNAPYEVTCSTQAVIDGDASYACSAVIPLPQAVSPTISGTAASDLSRYLTISVPYGLQTSYSIRLFDAYGNNIHFAAVQSLIDSTGRANDLFRRVESRVELSESNYPFPKYALAAYCEGDSCGPDEGRIVKDYWVSDNCYTIVNGEELGCGTPVQVGNPDFTHNFSTGF